MRFVSASRACAPQHARPGHPAYALGHRAREATMRHPEESDGNDVSRSEAYAGLTLMLVSFLVSVNVCSGMLSLAVLP